MNHLAWAASIITGSHQAGGAAQLDPAEETCPQLKGIWFYREQNPQLLKQASLSNVKV